MEPVVVCPNCNSKKPVTNLFTAQSNQNIIYECEECEYELRNIRTKKG
ncbi:hypothetical protein [Bacillus alkalicellulosilyticus]|nr:hypothetical protein [Bacillus alkalicellulosilyticus]